MKNRDGKKAIDRLSKYKLTKETRTGINKEDSNRYYDKKIRIAKNAQKKDEQLKAFDERYCIIVKVFMSEIEKRKIDIAAPDFEERLEEILQEITRGKFFQTRFSGDNIRDIKNTILRKINKEKQRIAEEGR